jgi:hypothetical protein
MYQGILREYFVKDTAIDMDFLVTLTSDYMGDNKPCDEAFRKAYVKTDVRGTDNPAKVPAYKGESTWWYSEGKNHRVEDGRIKRDFDAEHWFITANSLDELMALFDKYGGALISPVDSNPQVWMFQIVDDYLD